MSGLVLKMGGRPVIVRLMGEHATVTVGASHVVAIEGLEGITDALAGPFAAALDFGFKDHSAITDTRRRSRQAPQNSN
jgi:hypothetical protein